MIYALAGLLSAALMTRYRRPVVDHLSVGVAATSLSEEERDAPGNAVLLAMTASFVVLALVAGLRDEVGTDYALRYVPIFEFVDSGAGVETSPGYLLLNEVVAMVFDDYRWLFLIASTVTVLLAYRFITRMSLNPALSIAVYVFGGTYLEAFNLVRQSLALAILLNTIELALKGRWLLFVVLVLLAASFHPSALVWFLVWPAVRWNVSQAIRLLWVIGGVVGMILIPLGLRLIVERFAPQYSWYLASNYSGVRSFDPWGLSFAMVLFLLSLFLVNQQAARSLYGTAVLNLQALQIIVLIAAAYFEYSFSRLSYYFTPIQMLVIPLIASSVRNRVARWSLCFALLVLLSVAYYFKFVIWNSHGVFPYRSVF